MKTKLFSFFLALVASVGIMFASTAQSIGGLYYNLDESQLTAEVVTIPNGLIASTYTSWRESTTRVIPSSISYNGKTYNVTSIGEYAFGGCYGLTSITIPNSVTSIGSSAFSGCSGLTDIAIPSSVTHIGKRAFSGCSSLPVENNIRYADTYLVEVIDKTLSSYTIKNETRFIGSNAFQSCTNLVSVTIPDNVISIGVAAFSECANLTLLIIGNNVKNIGNSAFKNCTGLTAITLTDSVQNIEMSAFEGCSNLASITIGKSLVSIEKNYYDSQQQKYLSVFSGCENLTTIVWNAVNGPSYNFGSKVTSFTFGDEVEVIPESVCSDMNKIMSMEIPNSVTSIGKNAFSGCSGLSSIIIPYHVKTIGYRAFKGCSTLTSITIPDSVTNIADEAFCNCSGLTSVIIGNGVKSIGASAFEGCENVASVSLGNSVETIGYEAFRNCFNLTSVTIPSSVTSIAEWAFGNCIRLSSLSIGSGVTSIGLKALYNCTGLTSVVWNAKNYTGTLPFSLTSDVNAFNLRPQITSFTFGSEVEHIPAYLCGNMVNLTYVTIPNSVTSIGESAFSGCSGLTSVTIDSGVTSIGSNAFSGCSALTSMIIPNSVTSIGESAFSGCSGLTSVTIDSGAIGNSAFSGCSGLTSVTIGSGVTSIGSNAFSGCSALTSMIIPNSVTSIGESAFHDCSGLTSVTIGSGAIGNSAFSGCSGLTNVTIGSGVISIGSNAFSGCDSLTSVTVGNSVTSIGDRAFFGCTNIASVIWNAKNCSGYIFGDQVESFAFGDSVEVIPASLCSGMNKLSSISIPNSVTSIGNSAFSGCSGLTSVTIGSGAIGNSAFSGCSGLTNVTIGSGVISIGSNAFSGCDSLTFVTLNSNAIVSKSYAYLDNLNAIFNYYVTEYIIGDEVTSIGDFAFTESYNLTSVAIGNSVESIGYEAFRLCDGLTSVTIPNSVTSIGDEAFGGCYNLASVAIGNSVESIGERAFSGCYNLVSITCEAVTPPFCGDYWTFDDVSKTIPLYVPAGSINAYKSADVWSDFTNIRAIGSAYYTITFLDWDGTILKSESVEGGSSATPPANPSREGYTFTGWDIEFSNVTSDLTVTAQYTINTYIVTFTDWDGTELKTEQVEHGQSATAPSAPTREGYTFTGWDIEFSNITSDLTVTAQYTINTYIVTFTDWDGTELKTEQVEYGKSATAPADPTREGYTFTGWDIEFSNITSDLTVTAQYTINTYIVTFTDWDGMELKTEQVEYGKSATAPADPTREGYTFTGWDIEFSNITSDLTVTAQYTINTYIVTFTDWDGTELKTELVEYGKSATAPVDPTREGYTFIGWNKDFSNVQSDLTVTALYKQNDSSMTCADARDAALGGSTDEVTVVGYVTDYVYLWSSSFKSVSFWMADTKDGGKVFEAYRAKCETAAEAPNVGDKVKIVGKLSVYNQSTPEISNGSFEILEQTSEKTYYTIRFINWDGTELQSSPVEFATIPEYTGATPLRADDEYYTYEFSGWTPTISPAIKDFTYKATYKGTPKEVHGQAEETQTTEVSATPTEGGSVVIAWPAVDGATIYTIEIAKNGEIICTLVFNENGQLLAIRFAAPARDRNSRSVAAATQAGKGWTYTVTGMEEGATYTYSMTAKDENSETLFSQTIDFTMPTSQGIEDVGFYTAPQKVMKNGQIFILRGDKIYTITGAEVK